MKKTALSLLLAIFCMIAIAQPGNNGTPQLPQGTVGIEEIEQCDLLVYPNPASDFLQISSSIKESVKRIEILTINGAVVKRFDTYCERIDISPLAAGTYFIHIYTQEGMLTKKWFKSN